MQLRTFRFAAHGEFLNRSADLGRMEDWWTGRDRNALVLYGRRRVGKSWLVRAFAHGKPAVILVGEQRAAGAQLTRFAAEIEGALGVRPDLPDLPALIAALYALARERKVLAVIDELPHLLPAREADRRVALSAIQAIMEEREASQLKLMLCGSYIGQMRTLLGESSPLRGRLTPLSIEPLSFADAQAFSDAVDPTDPAEPAARIERYAVTGGMSLYLDELGRGQTDLRERVCERVLAPRAPLFNDPRDVLEEELRQPGVYFSLLEELAVGERALGDLGTALGTSTNGLGPYLRTLGEMRLAEQVAPVTAGRGFRAHRYRLADGFLRFWFRFVFGFQEDLRSGLSPHAHYDGEIAPALAQHVAPVFEQLCREWTRRELGSRASRVGSWWGNARNDLRRSGERSTEEIDVVGLQRSVVTIVGECQWTSRPMSAGVLADLDAYKIPAMRQARIRIAANGPLIVLFSRSGFEPRLLEAAADRDDVRLIELADIVDVLLRRGPAR